MLEGKLHLGSHLEVGRLAGKLPHDFPGLAIDLVSCIGVSGRYEVISLIIFVYRVDVKVIPSIRAVEPRTSLAWVQRKETLWILSAKTILRDM